MSIISKILLTIPSILALSYMVTYAFPVEFHWLTPTMEVYYIQVGILQGLTLLQLIILIRKLWSFKHVEKSKKSEWTWLLIIFNSISSLIFIWKHVDNLSDLNRMNSDEPSLDGEVSLQE